MAQADNKELVRISQVQNDFIFFSFDGITGLLHEKKCRYNIFINNVGNTKTKLL